MNRARVQQLVTEGAVIVASILLAFALDAWWDERQEQARVEEVLDAVADEFESEMAILDSIIAANEQAYGDYVRLLQATDPERPPLSEDSIRAWGERDPGGQIYESTFATLATLTSSGGLERISDLKLRRALAGWPAHLEDVEWSENQIYDEVDRLRTRQAELGLASELLEPGGVYRARVRATARDPLFRGYMTSLVVTLGLYNEGLRDLRGRAMEILAVLRSRETDGS